MYLGGAIYTSKILEHPEAMDIVEDPYVIVIENPSGSQKLASWRHKDMVAVMAILHARDWETVNITFNNLGSMVALFKNPRAKRKNQPETEG